MQIIYGTNNAAKIEFMKKVLLGLDIDILSFKDINFSGHIEENGIDPMENAKIKAIGYHKKIKRPVFSCDSGLFIKGLNEQEQPGVHVRRIDNQELTDEQMIEYYSSIAKRMGGRAFAQYRNAICLVVNEEKVYEYDSREIWSQEFMIADKPHKTRISGFPLDSISVNIQTGCYYLNESDGERYQQEIIHAKGFRLFFERVLKDL